MTTMLKDLLAKPAEGFERPPTLPAGTYTFVISSHKFGESAKKKTPYVQYELTPMTAEADVDVDALAAYGSLQKRKMPMDFYLTEDAVFRLTEFHEKLGHNTKLALSEIIPQAVNKIVRGVISHTIATDGKTTYANISDILGLAE